MLDVAVSRMAEVPIPDTSTLYGDLLSTPGEVAASLARPDGLAFLRAVLATGQEDERPRTAATAFLAGLVHRIVTITATVEQASPAPA